MIHLIFISSLQWCARESELQQHLAAEWRVRVNTIEANLRNQLAKCDTLQNRLSSALTNLSAREVIVKNREQKVSINSVSHVI